MGNLGYVIALVVSMVLGCVWYSDLMMGEVWAEAQGIDVNDEQTRRRCQKQRKTSLMATFSMYAVMVLVVSYLADQTGCQTVNDGLWLGALLWIGFAAPLAVVQHSYNPSGKKVVLLVDLSYQLIYFLAQGVCLVYFKNANWDMVIG
eukprot:306420_1